MQVSYEPGNPAVARDISAGPGNAWMLTDRLDEEIAMNDKTGRGLGRACALAVVTAVTLLTTACGVVHVHFGSPGGPASTGSSTYQEELAYAQCMRAHGLPSFPDPNPSGNPAFGGQQTGSRGSPVARANDACKHLLTGGS